MDPIRLITKYYQPDSLSYRVLMLHSQAVAQKAIKTAMQLNFSRASIEFIGEAALLHDIGIFYTSAREIGCQGNLPYICHGYMGHNLLLAEGLPKHALVCERHTGTGLSLRDLDQFEGLLPWRPMEPVSVEEKLIAYCDKFYSKDPNHLGEETTYEAVLDTLSRFGQEKVNIFKEWHRQFNR
jgi:uncharacterized protein